ncbi:MAG: hypothetical protein A2504_06860 [Bdellovibrionales bacterium RIFOXYD12_FULL_39_22]|nr:MAG: hypothetical protein A2385_09180 [Bdellovibrionales bacterium RIFOXYB1_FULL_39_21]OFZ45130.1 MAG: hypothetical protein A2485_05360 [Bdellovibrionales bacterium RIFOXYC12_FULL_39_17]OFZ45678.1 MAG: hypothetical protein A2404_03760 [Bdellovibrionales bacterium RIFOXYC1_FULL_39_130]OFZ72649.1 MAG: hypothetical protein A2451_14260 [Bdellovibrionales bacterium RIFOXYC2_FULL_39_8]OFZ77540.1 MAG: hypothetical protein A2560_09345 [Bdellovibrionales bacterium RIFOXYD1_FULL_39_84]OFZ91669.1 MAG:
MLDNGQIEAIKKFISSRLQEFEHQRALGHLKIDLKIDNSPVTELDVDISNYLKKSLAPFIERGFSFFSEEDHGDLQFPAIILDPIDGTRELISGTKECALSLAIISDFETNDFWGWIYNPYNGISLTSSRPISLSSNLVKRDKLLGFISRTEIQEGLFDQYDQNKYILKEVGSIAYKLGLISSGECDFIITKHGKNIWDIAGGFCLCKRNNIAMYDSSGNRIQKLNKERYDKNILWCREDIAEEVFYDFFKRSLLCKQ